MFDSNVHGDSDFIQDRRAVPSCSVADHCMAVQVTGRQLHGRRRSGRYFLVGGGQVRLGQFRSTQALRSGRVRSAWSGRETQVRSATFRSGELGQVGARPGGSGPTAEDSTRHERLCSSTNLVDLNSQACDLTTRAPRARFTQHTHNNHLSYTCAD